MNRKNHSYLRKKRQLTIPQKIFFLRRFGFSTEAECILRGNEIVLRPVREQGGGEFAEQILADLIDQGFSGRSASDRIQENAEKGPPSRRSNADTGGAGCPWRK